MKIKGKGFRSGGPAFLGQEETWLPSYLASKAS